MTSKARQLAEFIANADVDSDEIATGAVSASKLAATLDLSSKTISMPDVAAFNITSGNVGIGTANPAEKFHIASSSGNTILNLQRTNTNTTGTVGALTFTASDGHVVAAVNALGDGNDDGANLQFRTTSAASGTNYYSDTDPRMTILGSNGNVGIGTTTPADKMHIKNDSGTTVYKAEVNANSIVGFGILKTGSTNQEWAIADGVTVNGKLQIYDVTDSRSVMTFDGAGNVGIGTISPGVKLHVDGAGSQPELRVSQNSTYFTDYGVNHIDVNGPNDLRFLMGGSEKIRIKSNGDMSIGSDHSGFSGWRVLNMRQLSTGALINFEDDDGTRASTFAAWGSSLRYQTHIAGGYHKFETDASTNAFQINDNGHVVVNIHQFPSNPTGSKLNVFGDGEVLRLDGTGNTSRTLRFRGVSTSNPGVIMADGSLEIMNEDANTSIALLSERDITIKTTKSNGTAGHVKFYSYNTEIMRIDGGSNKVGINTTNPIEELDVDGTIRSGNSSKPINATYNSGGVMNSFEHRFNRVKFGANSPHVLVDIQFTSNFHQAMFVIEYGARLQAVSDSTTNAVIRSFGVNRFNGGNCNITDTNNTHFSSTVSSHAPIYINVVSQTRYQIVVNFSGTLGGSSFVSGSIRGYGVNSEFPTITFSDGLNEN